MKTVFIDESGITSFRAKNKEEFFALGGLITENEEEINSLFNELKKYLVNNEIKYETYKKSSDTLNSIIHIINNSKIKYHLEICQPYIYYYTLLIDYLIFPYWLFNEDSANLKKKFFYAVQEFLDFISVNEIKDFFLIENFDAYKMKDGEILEKIIKKSSDQNFINIIKDAKADFLYTEKYLKENNFDIKKIKPIPDIIGGRKKNVDILFIPHIQCLYQFLNKFEGYDFIHDNNFRLQNYIMQVVNMSYPHCNFKFKDSKSEEGLIIIDFIISYYKHCFERIINNDFSLEFNPSSFNLVISTKNLKIINKYQIHLQKHLTQFST